MKRLFLVILSLPVIAHAQAVRPAPSPGPLIIQQPPSYPGNPVHTPAGTGLPAPGQPGTSTQSLPRSPNTRILPATKEAGVWAADRTPKETGGGLPVLFGVPIPYPEMAGDDAESFVRACVGQVAMASYSADPTRYIESLPFDVRRCVAAMAYEECALRYRERKFPTIEARMALPPDEHERVAGVVAHAIKLRGKNCGAVPIEQPVRDALEKVLEVWRAKTP